MPDHERPLDALDRIFGEVDDLLSDRQTAFSDGQYQGVEVTYLDDLIPPGVTAEVVFGPNGITSVHMEVPSPCPGDSILDALDLDLPPCDDPCPYTQESE